MTLADDSEPILVRIATHARESGRAFTLRVNAAGQFDALWCDGWILDDLPRDCGAFVTTDEDPLVAAREALEGEQIHY